MTALSPSLDTTYAMRHEAARLLRSGDMCVEVMDPLSPARYNRGCRFTTVANVLRVSIAGRDFLYSPVEHDPISQNCGLAAEFDIGTAGPPPGFAEAAVGEAFMKVGVGMLRKNSPDYFFAHAYDIIAPAETTVDWGESTACFEQTVPELNGYAYRLRAMIVLEGSHLEIQYDLANIGGKSFATEHYNHNYFLFDRMPVGTGYRLEFPYKFAVEGLQPEQMKGFRRIDFLRPIPPHVMAINAEIIPESSHRGSNSVVVTNGVNGLLVGASVSLPHRRFALHATPAYLCPEQFVRIDLQPGASRAWVRRYEFRHSA